MRVPVSDARGKNRILERNVVVEVRVILRLRAGGLLRDRLARPRVEACRRGYTGERLTRQGVEPRSCRTDR